MMQIKLTPQLRSEWEMAVMADKYEARLIELFGSVADAKLSHDEWVVHHQPLHKWVKYNLIALSDATEGMVPREKSVMRAEVKF